MEDDLRPEYDLSKLVRVPPEKCRRQKTPQEGGCWYCCSDEPPLLFSCEFDTNVHEVCLRAAIEKDNSDREAAIMGRELLKE